MVTAFTYAYNGTMQQSNLLKFTVLTLGSIASYIFTLDFDNLVGHYCASVFLLFWFP